MTQQTLQFALDIKQVKPVYLNRDGKVIGHIVQVGHYQKKAYLSDRNQEHFFIKFNGFGIDSALLNRLIGQECIERIIIRYNGTRGLRYFISSIDSWYEHGVDVAYTKDIDGAVIETYGKQKILSTDYMQEMVVE